MSNAQSEELCQVGSRREEVGGNPPASQLILVTNQLLSVVSRLEARIAALEDDGKVTILHQDALKLGQLIKARARVLADKYQLGPAGERRIRAAIKKAVLQQYGIRDLHDLPARRLAAARMLIENWSSYQAIREAFDQVAGRREEGRGQCG